MPAHGAAGGAHLTLASVLCGMRTRLARPRQGGFRMILGSEPDIEVVGEATNGPEAVAITRQLAPEVVLMDIRMPELDGKGVRQSRPKRGDRIGGRRAPQRQAPSLSSLTSHE